MKPLFFFIFAPDLGSVRLKGNPVKFRSYSRSCKLHNNVLDYQTLIFILGSRSRRRSQKTCPSSIRNFRE